MVTDAGIVPSKNVAASEKLASYVRNGGILVLGDLISTELHPDDLGNYMRENGNSHGKPFLIIAPPCFSIEQ